MINQNLLLAGDDAYNLTKSLRFRSSASAYLNRTPASSSNLNTWTISWWTKRGQISTASQTTMFGTDYAASQEFMLQFTANNRFVFEQYAGAGVINLGNLITTQVFRDPSAWYHFVVTWDSTQATSTNRIKLYVNGVQITAFDTAVYPALNASSVWNQSTNQHRIGQYSTAKYYDGYMGELNFVDGQALTPSSFGSTNALTGVWQPAKYTGTYGTNGFYLPFTNTASTSTLGNDFSGNGNTWTVNNISLTAGTTYDSMTDVPTLTSTTTANYAIINPVSASSGGISVTNGNLSVTPTIMNGRQNVQSSIGLPNSGKWYWEWKFNPGTGDSAIYSPWIAPITSPTNNSLEGAGYFSFWVYTANLLYINYNGSLVRPTQGVTFSTSDVMQFAVDMNTRQCWLGKNNAWFDTSTGTTANPSAGTGYLATLSSSYNYVAGISGETSNITASVNFGQRPFSYTPPTGFVALNTFNLPEPSIKAGNKQMNVLTYSGDGANGRNITGFGFSPEFLWIKKRSGAEDHKLNDIVRGVDKQLMSNRTEPEYNSTDQVRAFLSDGFTTDNSGSTNGSGHTYVAWAWKANGSGSSNTSGSITSIVSANTSAGFSIVTYTGTGGSGTVGHGLGVAPAMMIVKSRNDTQYWIVQHQSLTSITRNLYLQLTDSEQNDAQFTAKSSTTVTINGGSVTSSGTNYVMYCFAEIAGYSKFGSYIGNGSTDGPFVYLGFRPKFVIFKYSSLAGEWIMQDTSRQTYNNAPNNAFNLSADSSCAENDAGVVGGPTNANNIDFLSNGFKIRYNNGNMNTNAGTYIYMAFAENPFRNSLAR